MLRALQNRPWLGPVLRANRVFSGHSGRLLISAAAGAGAASQAARAAPRHLARCHCGPLTSTYLLVNDPEAIVDNIVGNF
jgi:hypothetical protein